MVNKVLYQLETTYLSWFSSRERGIEMISASISKGSIDMQKRIRMSGGHLNIEGQMSGTL